MGVFDTLFNGQPRFQGAAHPMATWLIGTIGDLEAWESRPKEPRGQSRLRTQTEIAAEEGRGVGAWSPVRKSRIRRNGRATGGTGEPGQRAGGINLVHRRPECRWAARLPAKALRCPAESVSPDLKTAPKKFWLYPVDMSDA